MKFDTIDADGKTIVTELGWYETDRGREIIFGIDTPFETSSFAFQSIEQALEFSKKLDALVRSCALEEIVRLGQVMDLYE